MSSVGILARRSRVSHSFEETRYVTHASTCNQEHPNHHGADYLAVPTFGMFRLDTTSSLSLSLISGEGCLGAQVRLLLFIALIPVSSELRVIYIRLSSTGTLLVHSSAVNSFWANVLQSFFDANHAIELLANLTALPGRLPWPSFHAASPGPPGVVLYVSVQ
ncbi:hypothetical protein BIW11_05476 [Tropilaelaps mercedesae]|uniref:Uncharacterized protein n=1 Tax=Tropilaelaps mercedesae TaxID=418985 RepID=A0A1V9Y243_9ACAR|nr:hypothetical protein BIW11_05476 [Tropilaelaps mercedesae]